MRNKLFIITALIVLNSLGVIQNANAYGWYGGYHYGGWRDWDDGWYGGGWGLRAYPYAYGGYYPATTYTYVESDPTPVVVQPQQATPAWYYCNSPKGYYPYIPVCSSGWLKVPATPPH